MEFNQTNRNAGDVSNVITAEPTRLPLFQLGDFTLHSGQRSRWKIECDSLTPEDWEALAVMAVELLPPFGRVEGVPRGGLPFAKALQKHITSNAPVVLVVDDVWTTGSLPLVSSGVWHSLGGRFPQHGPQHCSRYRRWW